MTTLSRSEVAAQIMEHLCTCPSHGYSQPARFGSGGFCSVKTDAGLAEVRQGDRDCSSSVMESWELALRGTAYEGRITRYHYTGDMRQVLVASGLFTAERPDFPAERGDMYLRQGHTAMCLGGGKIGEFSISELGTIDGEPGDQTGSESHIRPYYGGWEYVLHYNGLADIISLEDVMQMNCIFQPDERGEMVYYDGVQCHAAGHPDEIEAVQKVAEQCNDGKRFKPFKLGTKSARWGKRFHDITSRGWKY